MTFSLVLLMAGHVFILDTGLSRTDCADAFKAGISSVEVARGVFIPAPADAKLYCEIEGARI